MHIVIDGYNLIHQSVQFGNIDRDDLQAGREALVDALVMYKKVKPYSITVVFDGHKAPPGMPRRERLKGIDLRYSKPGELADAVIKRMASREREQMMVVSSDREIIDFAARKGAAVISSSEFEQRLSLARMMDIKGESEDDLRTGWQPTTKKTGPSRRLSKRQRKMRRKISKL